MTFAVRTLVILLSRATRVTIWALFMPCFSSLDPLGAR
jgi:hypothetical protein